MTYLLILDVDGTLTDGKITFTNGLDEIKSFDVKDGLAISAWKKLGKEVAIITGRESEIVKKRAQELGINYLFQGVKDKYSLLLGLCEELDIDFDAIAAMGDDLNDFKMLSRLTKSFAPADAATFIQKSVNHVTQAKGGEGAVREMIEKLLKDEDQLERMIDLYR